MTSSLDLCSDINTRPTTGCLSPPTVTPSVKTSASSCFSSSSVDVEFRETFSSMMGEKDKWQCIYPAYLNSNRTVARGRKIPVQMSAVDPKWQEIKEVLESSGCFQVLPEPNAVYPRELDKEIPTNRGRVKYQVNPGSEGKFGKKHDVILFVGDSISKMKNRKMATAQPTETASTSTGGGTKSKKGKKK